MTRSRSFRKFLLLLTLTLAALLFITLLASQIEQRLFRRRTELLLSQLQSIELRKTPWRDVQVEFQRWGPNRRFDGSCDAHRCSLQISLTEPVYAFFTRRNIFIQLDDYVRWRLRLTYEEGQFARMASSLLKTYLRLGGHPARIVANIGIRNGVVWTKEFAVAVETYGHPIGWSGDFQTEFGLFASASSVSRFDRGFGGLIDQQLTLHPYYSIGGPSSCTICVSGWTTFTPYAAAADVRRLMEFDLSCLTRWGRCITQSDIMPVAWGQHLEERRALERAGEELVCPPNTLEILGRDSANIAVFEILKYQDGVDGQGYHSAVANVRLLNRLKGVSDWSVGETRRVAVSGGAGRENLNLPIGSNLVLFRRQGPSTDPWTASINACPVTLAVEPNLSLVRYGVFQDYSVGGKPG